MNIEVIGLARDLRTGTPVAYAQMSIDDYLMVVGDEFENFTIQRRRESHKAYQRLKLDIKAGALLPSITLAVKPDKVSEIVPLFEIAEKGGDKQALAKALSTAGQVDILDGLQRTYIINDLKADGVEFVEGQKILTEFWLESDINRLIYRIIVLNAGQNQCLFGIRLSCYLCRSKHRLKTRSIISKSILSATTHGEIGAENFRLM